MSSSKFSSLTVPSDVTSRSHASPFPPFAIMVWPGKISKSLYINILFTCISSGTKTTIHFATSGKLTLGHGFKPRWSPEFFSGFFTQLPKLRSLRRSFLHFQDFYCRKKKSIKILWQAVMKRAVKSFSYNRTVHVIWLTFLLRFQSKRETAFQNLVVHSLRPP